MNKSNISNMQITSRIPNECVYISKYVYISNSIYLIIFWSTMHQTLLSNLMLPLVAEVFGGSETCAASEIPNKYIYDVF